MILIVLQIFSLINRFGFISLFMVPEFLKSQCTKFAFVYRVGVKEFYNMFYRVVHYGFFTFFFKTYGMRDGGDDLRVVGALHP